MPFPWSIDHGLIEAAAFAAAIKKAIVTFRGQLITASLKLDKADGHKLGAVNFRGQLITAH